MLALQASQFSGLACRGMPQSPYRVVGSTRWDAGGVEMLRQHLSVHGHRLPHLLLRRPSRVAHAVRGWHEAGLLLLLLLLLLLSMTILQGE